jgi:hypothetical protein
MRSNLLCAGAALALLTVSANAEDTALSDGANAMFADPLLDKMVGHWTMTGTLLGRPANHTVDAQWILGHQFLQIYELGAPDPKTGKPQY